MPQLPHRVQSLLLRVVMNLPQSLQRRLVRRPVVIDGLTLSPELQLMLALQRIGGVPGVEELPLDEARPALVQHARLVGGRQPIGSVRDLVVDGAEGPLPARLYTPSLRLGADPAPTLMFIHGGGWVYGDLESHDAACRFLAEQSGVQVLAVDYRLAPEHPFPAAVQDCQAAFRWLVEHASEVNADVDRLAVGGDSAGGAMSATTAVYAAENDLPLAFQLLIYPGTDFVGSTESRTMFEEGFFLTKLFIDSAEGRYFAPGADKGMPDASPVRRVEWPERLAPAHVVTAGFDPLRDEGEAYVELLRSKGFEVTHERCDGMIHSFFNIVGIGHDARGHVRDIAERLRVALDRDLSSRRSPRRA